MTYIVSSGTLNPTIPYHTLHFTDIESWYLFTKKCL